MSKIKVSTLTGEALNDQVALALGWQQRLWGAIPVWFDPADENRYRCHVAQWKPSTNWSQGGPIIEREKIRVADSGYTLSHVAWRGGIGWGKNEVRAYGDTPLIAAMRCFVASRFGEEVVDAT